MSFPGRAPDPPGGPGMPGGYAYPTTPPEQVSGIQAVSGRTSPTLGPDGGGQRATGGLGPNSGRSADEALVGTVIDDRYVVEGVLGEGGMGVVYSARHSKLGRRYALKVLRRELADDQEILSRFMLEAQSASAIGNKHIVDIVDFGTLRDGSTYFAMEHLEGSSLTEIIESHPSAERIATIGVQVCDGLGAAHERGIVHRDLKPDNIFVTRDGANDFVKILDFGIAKVSTHHDGKKLTKAGAVFGTPHYMSPEQAAGMQVDHRADIYALGVILYEMAAGKLPFEAENFMAILTKQMYEAPAPIGRTAHLDCPPALEAIVQKCLEKRPERRYQTCAELGNDLIRFLRGEVVAAFADLGAGGARANAPGDYFRTAAIPGVTGQKGGLPLLGIMAGALLLSALGMAGFALTRPKAPVAEATPTVTAAPEATTAAPEVATTAAPDIAPAPGTQLVKVELRSSIPGAVVVDADVEKPLPATIEVEPGKKRSLIVKGAGIAPTVVEIDGTKPIVDFPVARAAGPRPVSGAPATTKPKPDKYDGPIEIFSGEKKPAVPGLLKK